MSDSLFASARRRPGAQRGERGGDAREAHDGVEDDVGRPGRGLEALLADEHRRAGRHGRGELARCRRVGHDHRAGAVRTGERPELVEVVPRAQAVELEGAGVPREDVERLGPDGAGRTEDGERGGHVGSGRRARQPRW